MTTVFYARPYGRFIEIQSSLRRKKLHRTNQEPQSNLEEIENPNIIKDDFSSRADPSIFTSIELVLLDQSNKAS